MDHELGEAVFKEHKCVLVIVGMEECARDVNGGNVASLVGINGGSDHDAVGCNGWGGSSSFLYTGWVRSLLPSATAHARTLLLHFLTIFMSDERACFRSARESNLAWTGW